MQYKCRDKLRHNYLMASVYLWFAGSFRYNKSVYIPNICTVHKYILTYRTILIFIILGLYNYITLPVLISISEMQSLVPTVSCFKTMS